MNPVDVCRVALCADALLTIVLLVRLNWMRWSRGDRAGVPVLGTISHGLMLFVIAAYQAGNTDRPLTWCTVIFMIAVPLSTVEALRQAHIRRPVSLQRSPRVDAYQGRRRTA